MIRTDGKQTIANYSKLTDPRLMSERELTEAYSAAQTTNAERAVIREELRARR